MLELCQWVFLLLNELFLILYAVNHCWKHMSYINIIEVGHHSYLLDSIILMFFMSDFFLSFEFPFITRVSFFLKNICLDSINVS